APMAMVVIMFAWSFWLVWSTGTDRGVTYFYLTAVALGTLLVGAEHLLFSVAIGVAAVGLIIFLYSVVLHNAPLSFVANLLGSSAGLFVIVFYAVRELTRAEERAEREHQRSESLLLNILPPRIVERLKSRPGAEIADAYDDASILFADMAGFTARASD